MPIISGGAGGGTAVIFDSLLAAPAASIDTGANSIPPSYKSLLILISARTAVAAATDNLNLIFNNDTSGAYDTQSVTGSNAATASGAGAGATAIQLLVHGDTGTANYPGVARVFIPNYAGTTLLKIMEAMTGDLDATVANNNLQARLFGWENTAAISRVKITPASAANLKTGSRMTIYGL